MPSHDIVCHDCEALWDDIVCSFRKREERGGIPCPQCDEPCKVSWHNNQAPGVLVQGSSMRVEGLKGEFSSYREVEKAADAKGLRIMESDEKDIVRESNREASAAYAQEIGFGSKQEYVEARKSDGEGMVHKARQKYVEQQQRRHGAGYDLGAKDKKWRSAGLSQSAAK